MMETAHIYLFIWWLFYIFILFLLCVFRIRGSFVKSPTIFVTTWSSWETIRSVVWWRRWSEILYFITTSDDFLQTLTLQLLVEFFYLSYILSLSVFWVRLLKHVYRWLLIKVRKFTLKQIVIQFFLGQFNKHGHMYQLQNF